MNILFQHIAFNTQCIYTSRTDPENYFGGGGGLCSQHVWKKSENPPPPPNTHTLCFRPSGVQLQSRVGTTQFNSFKPDIYPGKLRGPHTSTWSAVAQW